jgi:hypothetical protein
MKFETPKCPECGEDLRGTIESVKGVAELSLQDDGETFEYSGSTDVWWDEQRAIRDHEGRVNLICHNGHDWFSKVTEKDEQDSDWVDGLQPYRDAAKKLFHSEGELEIDAGAPVSKADPEDGGDEGAYVQAWVWVPDYEIPGQTPAEKKLRSRKKGGD